MKGSAAPGSGRSARTTDTRSSPAHHTPPTHRRCALLSLSLSLSLSLCVCTCEVRALLILLLPNPNRSSCSSPVSTEPYNTQHSTAQHSTSGAVQCSGGGKVTPHSDRSAGEEGEPRELVDTQTFEGYLSVRGGAYDKQTKSDQRRGCVVWCVCLGVCLSVMLVCRALMSEAWSSHRRKKGTESTLMNRPACDVTDRHGGHTVCVCVCVCADVVSGEES